MITLFIITSSAILLYLIYPLWLTVIVTGKSTNEKASDEINCVSVILLSFNGKQYLDQKIDFLVNELSCFDAYELIIIDDNSKDGSVELLKNLMNRDHLKILFNSKQEGIPFSMNLGVTVSKYDYLIFCDQRQELSCNILKKIVEPLRYPGIGAVSGCISYINREKKSSFLRKHENFLKSKESKAGSLIGVYGPFYAIKKQCYSIIPENIILDDLYLSLRILKSKQIELRKDCQIIDDNFSLLYDYHRTRRYLYGLLQILKDGSIINDLKFKQKVMLMWHKYFRLFIPSLIFLCYISLGISVSQGIEFSIAFGLGTVIIIFSILPFKTMLKFKLINLIRMNILYLIAFLDILINNVLLNHSVNIRN